MTYPDSVRFLYSLGNEVKTAKLGLDRIRELLDELGNPHQRVRSVHVAGTNGKGSTCAMIESGLRAAGIRTGLFTSPHLIEPTERIRICGSPVTGEQFAAAFDRVHAAAGRLLARDALDMHPTYFETVTAMAFVLFDELKVETVVLEVGLGGRLDATNVVIPELAVITPVDFDHEAFLGKSLESIASEKAGILKPGVPAVFSAQRPEVQAVLDDRAGAAGVEAIKSGTWKVRDVRLHPRGSSFVAVGACAIRIECPLAGEHQIENALVSAIALDRLGVPADAIQKGIAAARWPGRLELVSETPEIVLDGAHNPAGARALAAYIEKFYAGRRIGLIYAAMQDKAVAEMTATIFPLANEVIVTRPNQSRAVAPETIANMADHSRLRVAPNLTEALQMAREAVPEGAIFITGSLFLVGEARALLCKLP